jgi:hypothetical protein
MARFYSRANAARGIGGSDPGTTGGSDPGTTGGSDPGTTGGSDPGTTGGSGPVRIARKASTDLGPAVIAHRRLTFRIQHQEQTEWCWAAVAASVQQYFEPDSEPALELRQCKIANMVVQTDAVLNPITDPKCCKDPQPCNQPASLETALKKIHKWRNTLVADSSTGATGTLTFAQVQREIDRGRPVCAGITWKSGGGHFVVVRGYRALASGAHQLYIADPDNPSNLVDYDEFTMAYFGEGTWTSTDLVMNDWS